MTTTRPMSGVVERPPLDDRLQRVASCRRTAATGPFACVAEVRTTTFGVRCTSAEFGVVSSEARALSEQPRFQHVVRPEALSTSYKVPSTSRRMIDGRVGLIASQETSIAGCTPAKIVSYIRAVRICPTRSSEFRP